MLLTVREVAERLGVCTAIVYRLAGEGALPHRRIRNAIRFTEEDFAAFIAAAGRGGRS